MDVQPSTHRRRTLATLAAAIVASTGITAAAAAPASAGQPGHCQELNLENWGPCGVVYNEGTAPIGIFNNWNRPVPGYEGTNNWSQYAQSHPDTAAKIWEYWSNPANMSGDGATARLLPVHTDSQSLGAQFHDTDGFYIGPGMRAIVDIGPSHTCVIGPIYYKVHGGLTAHVYSGPSVC